MKRKDSVSFLVMQGHVIIIQIPVCRMDFSPLSFDRITLFPCTAHSLSPRAQLIATLWPILLGDALSIPILIRVSSLLSNYILMQFISSAFTLMSRLKSTAQLHKILLALQAWNN